MSQHDQVHRKRVEQGEKVEKVKKVKKVEKVKKVDSPIAREQLNEVKNGTCSKEYLTKCRVCDKTFNRKDSLVLHLGTVHLKERRFKCEICQQGFTSNKDLTRHSGNIPC